MRRVALVASFAAACVGSTTSAPPPAALVGSWYAGAGGVSAPYDPTTGTFGTPNGEGLVYVLRGDGTYTKAFQSYASNGGCTSGFTAFEAGTFEVDGASLRTIPSSGHLQYQDTCAPSLDSDKPSTDLADEAFTIELGGDELTLVRTSDGATGHFRRISAGTAPS